MYPLLLPPLCRHWKENFLIVSVARCHLRSVCCRCTAIKQSSCCCREWEKERERKIVQTVQRVSQRARAARVFEPEHLNAHLIPCQKMFSRECGALFKSHPAAKLLNTSGWNKSSSSSWWNETEKNLKFKIDQRRRRKSVTLRAWSACDRSSERKKKIFQVGQFLFE